MTKLARYNPYAKGREELLRLKNLRQVLVSSIYLSFDAIERLNQAFYAFAYRIPKWHSLALREELSRLMEGRLPQRPSRYMASLVVYTFTGNFYNIKATYVFYEAMFGGFELCSVFWHVSLSRNKNGKAFKEALREVAMRLKPNFAQLKDEGQG